MHRTAPLAALALTALTAWVARPAEAAGGPRWNVVLISADTLRGDVLPMNGGAEVAAPHLEALAAEGVNFRRAYANVTTTTPSHASLFSSLYPSDHGAWTNQARLADEVTTLAQVLKAAGWRTAGIVNMPWMNPDVTGVTRGVDELARGDRVRKADRTTDWVLDYLDRRGGERAAGAQEPFFLFVHYVDNHTPYHAPGSFDRLYYPADKDPRADSAGTLQEAWRLFPKHHAENPYFLRWIGDVTDADYVVGTYKGSVTWLDLHVGRIVARLKAQGLWDDTLVVFTADHGESLGEHGLWFTHGGLYEPTTRVPLVVRVPDGPRGRQVDTVVDLVDVAPTVLARLGLALPGQPRGEDLWPLAQGGEAEGAALLEHTGRYLEGVVTPRWKLIRHLRTRTGIFPAYPIRKGQVELYDLAADPGETRNVAANHPEKVAELRALLDRLKAGGHAFDSAPARVDAETEEALRSLGYVQ